MPAVAACPSDQASGAERGRGIPTFPQVALPELEFARLPAGCGIGVSGGGVPCEGRDRGRLRASGVRTSFIFKTCSWLRAVATVGVLHALTAAVGAAQPSAAEMRRPSTRFGVVGFKQTSCDLCRNLQLQGFVFLPYCRQ